MLVLETVGKIPQTAQCRWKSTFLDFGTHWCCTQKEDKCQPSQSLHVFPPPSM